uniref:Uncharacterized protein n=1 Tax=Avena sativa TaxID=4498 RepID=A0ACD5WRW0_AVESA
MMQYLDFSHASTSRKWTNKQRQPGEGFDAPRNSMEFVAMEAPHSYGVFQEDASYSCSSNNNMRQYPKASAPIKKLIHEDLSLRQNEGHKRVPSVIARLMGMDSPPLNSATGELVTAHPDDRRQETTIRSVSRRERDPAETVATKHVSFVPQQNSVRHAAKLEIRSLNDEEEKEILGQLRKKSSSGGGGGGGEEWSKPAPREHPQEEELQKFKKEFAAWQASKVWEQSKAMELDYRHAEDDDGGGGRCSEIVPYRFQQQEKQHRGGRDSNRRVHDDVNGDAHWKRRSKDSGGPSISGSRTFSLTSAAEDCSSTRLPLSRFYYEEEEKPLSPARIVILKPCPELSADDVDESSMGSPELMKNENNMEAFLEEVKMRLKFELEGHIASDDRAADRWADVPADPKQIARNIANQIRDTVTMEMHHPALVRSESTRSYRSSDVQSQMDYICRDARKQLTDRLRNVLRREPEAEPPFGSHQRRPAASTLSPSWFDEEPRPKPTSPRRDVAARKSAKKIRSKEEKKRAIESSEVRSFRHGYKNSAVATVDSSDEAVSPRNLMRSFSAPVSGTNFVKHLSEGEPRVQRKHERQGSYGTPTSPEEKLPKGRKDALGIKGRVSNLRQNLGLRGLLFGKKLHSAAADESSSSFFLDDFPPIGTLVTAPSVLIHPGVLQENSTEVPPSPASWCSSPPDEMMIRGGYPSPVSPLEASFSERRSPLKPGASSSACEQGTPWLEREQVAETSPALHDDEDDDVAEMDDPMKAFMRAVLDVAGMYGPSENSADPISSPSQLIKPIPKRVFDEVLSSSAAPAGDVGHQLLFDLINEALPGAVRGTTTLCTFSKWYAAPRRAPSGKRLLDGLCKTVLRHLEPPSDEDSRRTSSVDGLIERDMSMFPWVGVFRDDVDGLGEEMEAEILSELVDETLWDVLLNVGD